MEGKMARISAYITEDKYYHAIQKYLDYQQKRYTNAIMSNFLFKRSTKVLGSYLRK